VKALIAVFPAGVGQVMLVSFKPSNLLSTWSYPAWSELPLPPIRKISWNSGARLATLN
jgi:hypothetical protein